MSIANECMTVNIQIGFWQGTRLDKEASRAVTEQANAESDAARVNKHIIPRETMKPIVSAASAIRNHFYATTLPWKDNGDRLLPRKIYYNFIDEHEKLKFEFDKEVGNFLQTTYPGAVARAEFRMGGLFNPNDYPSVEQLRRRFYVNMDIDAITEASDFRVKMDGEHLERIKGSIEKALAQRISQAMESVWTRLADTLQHYANKMDSDEIFRNSTVENLRGILDALPGLNITNDPKLIDIQKQIETALKDCFDPKELRSDTVMRQHAGKNAKKILSTMQAYMSAFQE